MFRNMIFIIVLLVSGCSMKPGETATLNVFTSADRFNNYWMLKHKDYEARTPLAKDSDWGELWSHRWNPQGGWDGGQSDSGHGLHLATKDDRYLAYDIDFYVSISPYSQADRALENGDEEFLRKYYNSYVGKITINKEVELKPLYLEHYGKENYSCEVREFLRPLGTYGMQVETYYKRISCLKSNPKKTMAKTVSIELIYTKAKDLPKELESIAKDYTYEDLQQRAKRMLDSLCIKDGWDK